MTRYEPCSMALDRAPHDNPNPLLAGAGSQLDDWEPPRWHEYMNRLQDLDSYQKEAWAWHGMTSRERTGCTTSGAVGKRVLGRGWYEGT